MIMNPSSPKEVIILGMHRSGTSMVGGVLSHLGVDLGDDSPGRQISNPLGHFEDRDFLEINAAILAEAGGSWDHPPQAKKILENGKLFFPQIQKLLDSRRESNQGMPWGWKDPRTSLTLELFAPYLSNALFIWCQRNPDEIAASLWQRNKIIHEEGLELVKVYEDRIAEFFSKNRELPLLKVSYQDVIEHPEVWVKSLISFLDLSPNEDQVDHAIAFVLTPKGLKLEKNIFRLKYWFSLPYRAYQRLLRKK